jgi:integrase
MPKITKRLVDSLRPEPGRDLVLWDSELRGFGLRLKPTGAGAFIVQYRNSHGRSRRMTLGRIGVITPDEARNLARDALAGVAKGADPVHDRREAYAAETVAELCERYMEAARAGLVTTRFGRAKRSSTISIDAGRISRHIVPILGAKVANSLTRADVQRMADAIAAGKTAATIKTKARGIARVTGGAGTATRIVGLFGGIWTWAEKRGFVSGTNPAHGLDLRSDQAGDRVVSVQELARLGAELRKREAEVPMACAALRLIALTGLRRGEAYGLRWSEVDLDSDCLRLAESKTGRSMRAIGRAAVQHLRSVPRLHDELVFPGKPGTGPADLKKQIAAIFDAAGLNDARGHDLRRTFASVAADEGYSDATIGELLGHARRGVTARHYIRRPDYALVAAADKVAARIGAAMNGAAAEAILFHGAEA